MHIVDPMTPQPYMTGLKLDAAPRAPMPCLGRRTRPDQGTLGHGGQARRAWQAVTPEGLREVATIVQAHRDRRTEAVSTQLHTSRRNATPLIRMAIDKGFLEHA
jgi:hypothetical protein